ncbi:MAG: hypothetical protein HY397_01225 [Candidatus Doudnabacteria bacterium]|nr:hypothetical protein [Candidatus Doudnabacteria bacterium]
MKDLLVRVKRDFVVVVKDRRGWQILIGAMLVTAIAPWLLGWVVKVVIKHFLFPFAIVFAIAVCWFMAWNNTKLREAEAKKDGSDMIHCFAMLWGLCGFFGAILLLNHATPPAVSKSVAAAINWLIRIF